MLSTPSLAALRATIAATIIVAIVAHSLGGATTVTVDDELLSKAVAFIQPDGGNGFTGPVRHEVFAPDMVLRGPLVGPVVGIEAYSAMMSVIGPYAAFEMEVDVPSCWRDPKEHKLISCAVYHRGKHTKTWLSPFGKVEPTGRTFTSSGEIWSVLFDDQSRVRLVSPGYAINAHRGTGCGYGGVFAIKCAVDGDTEAAEAALASIARQSQDVGKSKEEPPAWWLDFCEGPVCP